MADRFSLSRDWDDSGIELIDEFDSSILRIQKKSTSK